MTVATAKIQGSELNDPARWNAGVTATTGGKPVSQTQDIQFGDDRMAERYWAKVSVNAETGCWEWVGSLSDGGYGKLDSRRISSEGECRTHRLFYKRLIGPIPQGLALDHLCRVRHCVNPSHLEPVTNAENIRRGLSTKISESQAAEIKVRARNGEHAKDLGREFGIHRCAVDDISHGRSWVDVAPTETREAGRAA